MCSNSSANGKEVMLWAGHETTHPIIFSGRRSPPKPACPCPLQASSSSRMSLAHSFRAARMLGSRTMAAMAKGSSAGMLRRSLASSSSAAAAASVRVAASSSAAAAAGVLAPAAAATAGKRLFSSKHLAALLGALAAAGSMATVVGTEDGELVLFSGNANIELASEIATLLGVSLGNITVGRFADGEVNVQVHDNVRGKDVYIIQPTCSPVNEHLMELLLMISTMRRASADKITAVIPYYGYARQDRKMTARVPISAADVATLLTSMGVDRVVAVDLHCGQIQAFFPPNVPCDNLGKW